MASISSKKTRNAPISEGGGKVSDVDSGAVERQDDVVRATAGATTVPALKDSLGSGLKDRDGNPTTASPLSAEERASAKF